MKALAFGLISNKNGKLLPCAYRYRRDALVEANHYLLKPKVVKVTIALVKKETQ